MLVGIHKSGYLTKRGHVVKNWKVRYFTTGEDRIVRYYEDDKPGARERGKLRGQIKMSGTTIEEEELEGRPHAFSIISTDDDGKDFICVAESRAEQQDWIRILRVIADDQRYSDIANLKGMTEKSDLNTVAWALSLLGKRPQDRIYEHELIAALAHTLDRKLQARENVIRKMTESTVLTKICNFATTHQDDPELLLYNFLVFERICEVPGFAAILIKAEIGPLLCNAMKAHPSHPGLQARGCYLFGELARKAEFRSTIIGNGLSALPLMALRAHFERHAPVARAACFALCMMVADGPLALEIGRTASIHLICVAMRRHRYDSELQRLGCVALNRLAKSIPVLAATASAAEVHATLRISQRNHFDNDKAQRQAAQALKMWNASACIWDDVKANDIEAVKRYVQDGGDINATDSFDNGASLLQIAVECGHVDLVREMFRLGANVNIATPKSKFTALHAAARIGHINCVKLLVELGASVNARLHPTLATALMVAVEYGHLDTVSLLIQSRSDVNARWLNKAGKQRTVLDLAVSKQHSAVAQLLQQHGAKSTEQPMSPVTSSQRQSTASQLSSPKPSPPPTPSMPPGVVLPPTLVHSLSAAMLSPAKQL